MSLIDIVFTKVLPPVTSALLLFLVYFQYRIQRDEHRPNLTVPRAAYYKSVCEEEDRPAKKEDIGNDEILFEITNLGSGRASQVRAESTIWIEETGIDSNDSKETELPLLSKVEVPRTLTLDVFREDVYHSKWKDSMEATVPGNQSRTGYLAELHIKKSDGQESLDQLLRNDYPEKAVFRLRLQLQYDGAIAFRDYNCNIFDIILYPGLCDNLEEAMEVGVPHKRYARTEHEQAVLNAIADIEKYRTDAELSDNA